jgi:hypothetical protein
MKHAKDRLENEYLHWDARGSSLTLGFVRPLPSARAGGPEALVCNTLVVVRSHREE